MREFMIEVVFYLIMLVILGAILGAAVLFWTSQAEAQSCWNWRLCEERGFAYGTYYGPPPISRLYYYGGRSYPYRYHGGYYGYDWRVEAVRGGLGVVGQVMDNTALAGVSRDQRDIAMAQIHATATRDARPGRANVSSSWGHVETEYGASSGSVAQNYTPQPLPLVEPAHLEPSLLSELRRQAIQDYARGAPMSYVVFDSMSSTARRAYGEVWDMQEDASRKTGIYYKKSRRHVRR